MGDHETEVVGIRSKPGDKFPPSQWQYYHSGFWHKDDATLTIESQCLPCLLVHVETIPTLVTTISLFTLCCSKISLYYLILVHEIEL